MTGLRPLFLCACLAAALAPSRAGAQPGPMLFDFENGFAVSSVSVAGMTASLERGPANTRLALAAAAGGTWRSAALSLAARDLAGHLGVIMVLSNPTARGFAVFGHIDDTDHAYPSNVGNVWLDPGATDTLYVHMHRTQAPAYLSAALPGMFGLPGGYTRHWENINPARVDMVRLSTWSPEAGRSFAVDDIRAWGNLSPPTEAQLGSGYLPLLDTLGQFRHGAWPGKAASGAELAAQAAAEAADLAAHKGPAGWDAYGGWAAGPALEATGRFRTEKVAGKWWLVTPEGRLFWSQGMDCVGNGVSTPTAGRENLFPAPIPSGGNYRNANLRRKFGADGTARANLEAHQRLRSWGMNSIGNWSDASVYNQKKTPYTVNFETGARENIQVAADTAAFRAAVRARTLALKASAGADPWCIGVFSDNELAWPAANAAALGQNYYRIVSEEMKANLPGVLYLGSRIHNAPEAVWRACGVHCDVVSFNRYDHHYAEIGLPADVDRPAMLTEFHVGALDRGLPHPGLRVVFNQRQRAAAFADIVAQCLLNPRVVGAHWFQYIDQVYTGRGDGENYQIGFVDILDKPYPEMVAAARNLGTQLYAARTAGQRPTTSLRPRAGRAGLQAFPGSPGWGRGVDALGRRPDGGESGRTGPPGAFWRFFRP